MRQLTDIEIDKGQILKAYRTAIRLKHALNADREIAETLPRIEKQIDDALQGGLPLELTVGRIFDEA